MRRFERRARVACTALLVLFGAGRGNAQSSVEKVPESVLSREITISVTNAPLADVLALLRFERKVPLAWSGDIIPPGFTVSLSVRNTALRGALEAVLSGSRLHYVVTPLGTVVIIPRRDAIVEARGVVAESESREVARALAATGVKQLDAVVVMGSAVAKNPEREQPAAIAVVHASQLTAARAGSVADVVRTLLPGIILWDRGPAGPPAPIAAVRGVSSFTTRALKTYVDGIELASPELFTLVDARGIERIEVLRGPQGAALYGPDALNGILQIETRHGRIGAHAPVLRASASAGVFERPDLSRAEPSQDYAAGLTGGTQSSAFDLSGGVSRVGRVGDIPLMQTWSVNGGGRALIGSVLVDASARIGRREYAIDSAAATPDARVSRDLGERGVAVTATHNISDRWRQTLIAGYHRVSGVREPFRSPLLTPTLPFGATDETASRLSLRYSSALDLSSAVSLSAGAEHSARDVDRSARTGGALGNRLALSRNELHSTGGFAQTRVRAGARLVISGGARAEHLSSVSEGVGLLWASTAGASWSHEYRAATLRLRAAWGNGIRPPEPGMNQEVSRGGIEQEANPALVPERQRGIEAGADLFFTRGTVVKVTWYDQRAIDLIQQVRRRPTDTTRLVYQFQNIGAVKNNGIELEASSQWGRLGASAIAYFPRSTVQRLSPTYGGELRAGDQLIEVPDAAGAATLRYDAGRLHGEAGVSWIGSWTGYDWVVIKRAEANLATRRAAERDYWLEYPSVARPFIALSIDLPREYHAFARVDNPANKAGLVRDNLSPPLGRVVMVGVSLRK